MDKHRGHERHAQHERTSKQTVVGSDGDEEPCEEGDCQTRHADQENMSIRNRRRKNTVTPDNAATVAAAQLATDWLLLIYSPLNEGGGVTVLGQAPFVANLRMRDPTGTCATARP